MERAVHRNQTDRNFIANPNQHFGGDVPHKIGGVIRHNLVALNVARRGGGDLNLLQPCQGAIDGLKILADHGFALAGIGFADRLLDMVDCGVAWQHAGNGEEAGLQDGVDAGAETGIAGDLRRVDDEEAQDRARICSCAGGAEAGVPHLSATDRAVEEEGAPRLAQRGAAHPAVEEAELMAGVEARRVAIR